MLSMTDLAKNVAASLDISQADAKSVVTAVMDEIRASLLDPSVGGVRTDIGQFVLVEREARTGRNPFEGTTIDIPAGYAVKFKFSSTVKKAVKEMKRGKAKAGKAAAAAPAKAPAKAAPAAKRGRPAAAKAAPAKAAAKPVAKAAKAAAKPVAKAAKAAPAAKRGRPAAKAKR